MGSFGRDVRDWLAGSSVPDWAIEVAVKRYEEAKRAKREHVVQCAGMAQGLSINLKKDEVSFTGLAPSVHLDSERLAEGMRSEIENIRKCLFGGIDPPFKTLRESVQWIEETRANYQGRASCKNNLAYAIPENRWVHLAPAFIGSPLEPLAELSERFAKATGLHQAAVVAYVLVGIPPILPPVRIAIHHTFGGAFPHTWASIEIFSGELSFVQLRKLYNRIRERMGTTRKKALNNRDVQLLEFVRKMGQPPGKLPGNRGAIKAYWQGFEKEWNRVHRRETLSWRAAQNRYERLRQKTAGK